MPALCRCFKTFDLRQEQVNKDYKGAAFFQLQHFLAMQRKNYYLTISIGGTNWGDMTHYFLAIVCLVYSRAYSTKPHMFQVPFFLSAAAVAKRKCNEKWNKNQQQTLYLFSWYIFQYSDENFTSKLDLINLLL